MSRVYSKQSELTNKIVSGVQKLSEAVGTTLGPKGRNVIIHPKGAKPFITKDGVTVATNVILEDPFENVGAQVLKQVSQRTVEDCGDGTTTSTVLASAILLKSHKYITAGSSPVDIRRGMERAVEQVTEKLMELSRPVRDIEEIENIATISANGDKKIGKLVATAIDKAGIDGAISVEDGHSNDTTLDIVEGFQLMSGFASSQFITDDRLGVMRYENALVLVTDHTIETVDQMIPILEQVARDKRPFIIVTENVEGQALAALIMNAVRGTMRVGAVKAPRYGQERKNILSDLALATGATFVSKESGMLLQEVKLKDLGMVKSVESNKLFTTFVGGKCDLNELEKRIETLKTEIGQTEDMVECGRIQDRITRLASAVAVIKVGGVTEVDMTERKHRIEDAISAVKSAQEEGILPGGGIALLRASRGLELNSGHRDEDFGAQIIMDACEAPIRRIAENCGLSPDVIIANLLNGEQTVWNGYNFATEKYVDMGEAGIVDPAKVTRCALQNAVSAASTLMTTNYAIIEL